MAPPQFIPPAKRRRLDMPDAADGFAADTTAPRRHTARPRVHVLPAPPKTPLKHPPSFSLPPARHLRPPPPPPPIQPKPDQDKDLKTISTTSIGLLNSLSSSNGGEDLAALLLPHAAAPALVTPTSRGVELSPEKRGKGHSPRFTRGGLAARASALFSRAHTSLVLWQKETERRASSPDMTATVVSILHLPRPRSKPSPVLALCRIHHPAYTPNQLYRFLFSVPQLSLDRFKPGLTVRIFHPWHELSSTHPSPPSFPTPAALPLPLSLPSTPDLPINPTITLFCSRLTF